MTDEARRTRASATRPEAAALSGVTLSIRPSRSRSAIEAVATG